MSEYVPPELSDHLCECGCGRFTKLVVKSQASRGLRAGEPRRYCSGHQPRRPRVRIPGEPTGRKCACGCRRETLYTEAGTAPKTLPGHRKKPMQLKMALGKDKPQRYRVDENGCWVWLLKTETDGYPALGVNRVRMRAHRWYYEQFKGPIPEGFHVHHECRNRLCVNPDHLTALSQDEHTLEHLLERMGPEKIRARLAA